MRPNLFRGLLLAVAFLLSAAAVQAQTSPEPIDYERWASVASRAEQVIEAGRASDSALESLRSDLAGWRERLLAAQGVNASRIQTLQAQLDALGPVPEEGGDPDPIANRRAELTAQLAELRAPIVRAEEAYTQANGLVSEIDSIIRDRQTDELLELGPTPLNPVLWAPAVGDLLQSLDRLRDEIVNNVASPALRAEARTKLPRTLFFAVLGLMLILRGHAWARAAVRQLRGAERRGSDFWRRLLSLGQILLPLAGIYALAEALNGAGLLGQRWSLLLENVPLWAAVLLGVRWLADQAFHEDDDLAVIRSAPEARRAARAMANLLSSLFVIKLVLDALIAIDGYAPATEAVLNFPLLLLSGLILFNFGRVRARAVAHEAESGDHTVRQKFSMMVARAAMIVGVAGPALAAVGYGSVGLALVYPGMQTLALIGLVLVLQDMVNALYRAVTGSGVEDKDSLIPVVIGFLIALAAIPPLALIWGARVADLTEIWTRVQEGFLVGDRRITPSDFLLVIVVFIGGYTLTRLVQGALRTSVLPRTRMEQGGQDALVAGTGYLGVFLAALAAIGAGGLDLSSLAFVAGALSVGIGFGLRTIVENFVSGIILLAERPISQGDWIEVNGQHGIVKEIAVRSTRIETFDRFDLIVPNADLVSSQVRNYTKGNLLGRIIVPVGVAYGTDTRRVEKILLNIARDHPMVLMNPAPYVYFKGFGADALEFEIRAILRDVNESLGVRTEMNHQIAQRFAEERIEIPFAQRDIWLRNPETLMAAQASRDSAIPGGAQMAAPASAGTAGAGGRPGGGDDGE